MFLHKIEKKNTIYKLYKFWIVSRPHSEDTIWLQEEGFREMRGGWKEWEGDDGKGEVEAEEGQRGTLVMALDGAYSQ
jgi:hypothetical protein